MSHGKAKFAALQFERICDELEFIQRIMELYDVPETVAAKVTEHIGGLLDKYECDMLDMVGHGDDSAVSEYLGTKSGV